MLILPMSLKSAFSQKAVKIQTETNDNILFYKIYIKSLSERNICTHRKKHYSDI